jgi:hypothetical protein
MRLLVTGGSGVLGRALRPLADAAGHDVRMPSSNELDVFDPVAVAAASRDVDAVLHLATRIQSLELISQPDAWWENDRLRADASRILVDAALAAAVEVYVQPTVTFVYPPRGAVSEDTPPTEVIATLRSALRAEQETGPVCTGRAAWRRASARPPRRPRHRKRTAQWNVRRHRARRRRRPRSPRRPHRPERDLQRLP